MRAMFLALTVSFAHCRSRWQGRRSIHSSSQALSLAGVQQGAEEPMHPGVVEEAEEATINMTTTRASMAQAMAAVAMAMMHLVVMDMVTTLDMLVRSMELACRWFL